MKKFQLGRLVATPAALDTIERSSVGVVALLARHMAGDWGDLCEEDRDANDRAVEDGDRIFSAYDVGEEKVWIITEADRSATTVLLPGDY